MQLEAMRQRLQQLRGAQLVYFKVSHWSAFPHVRWDSLAPHELQALERHFHRCPGIAPYIRGERKLPPDIPTVSPW
jgi:hypothetical protein